MKTKLLTTLVACALLISLMGCAADKTAQMLQDTADVTVNTEALTQHSADTQAVTPTAETAEKEIHASGTKVGVIQTPIDNSGWTHWLKIPYITYYDSDVAEAPNEKHIWDVLYAKIGNPYGVAALMGNLYAESGLQSNNLQNTYEESLGYSDASYTQAVDSGSYTNFTSDSAGYGLAQWTVEDRKTPLLAFANARGCSIADLDMQLDFLCNELETKFPGVLSTLKNAKSVREASKISLGATERTLRMASPSSCIKNCLATEKAKTANPKSSPRKRRLWNGSTPCTCPA